MNTAFALKLRLTTLILACAGMPMVGAIAQATSPPAAGAAKTWSYDAVSVKPNQSGTNRTRIMMNGGVYQATNVRVIDMISSAYNIKVDLISGMPGWTDGARYDVTAKMSPEDAEALDKMTREERTATSQAMMLAMLTERFHLKAHVETKELPVYDLVIAKGGSKIKEAMPGDTYENGFKGMNGKGGAGMMHMGAGELTVQGVEISGLVNVLVSQLHRTVLDKTGLKGKYDFTLKFAPDHDGPPGGDSGSSTDDAPSIFAALEEQLGLKLQPSKGPVDTLVIDHVEQPTEN